VGAKTRRSFGKALQRNVQHVIPSTPCGIRGLPGLQHRGSRRARVRPQQNRSATDPQPDSEAKPARRAVDVRYPGPSVQKPLISSKLTSGWVPGRVRPRNAGIRRWQAAPPVPRPGWKIERGGERATRTRSMGAAARRDDEHERSSGGGGVTPFFFHLGLRISGLQRLHIPAIAPTRRESPQRLMVEVQLG
jgi:hypothetical protein